MITAIAQTLSLFCMMILVAAAAGWLLAYMRGLRGIETAQRIAVLFAVFALAAGYVWLDLGPEIDARMAAQFAPLLGEPQPLDV